MQEFLLTLCIGGFIGWIAQLAIGREVRTGIVGSVFSGITGTWVGSMIIGNFGPQAGGIALIPALFGTLVFVFIASLFLKERAGQEA
ncbi:GlsB/YeaQ/YmgE family stress response membrane protein [Peribacillus sp. SCS-37]|uniref:GlsB/YeaQ/YmgE family stress response membrane protein n=1 Tax=Paraperibacillus esterisolvens TaxID=3115296 RepID=UPI003906A8B3